MFSSPSLLPFPFSSLPAPRAEELAVLADCMRARRTPLALRPRSADLRAPMLWARPICRFMACVPTARKGAGAGRRLFAFIVSPLSVLTCWRVLAPNVPSMGIDFLSLVSLPLASSPPLSWFAPPPLPCSGVVGTWVFVLPPAALRGRQYAMHCAVLWLPWCAA